MSEINYLELRFDHIVVFTEEDTIYACAQENGSHTRLFLIFGKERGRVYARNGLANTWELLHDYDAQTIRNFIPRAILQGVPVYHLRVPSESVTGLAK